MIKALLLLSSLQSLLVLPSACASAAKAEPSVTWVLQDAAALVSEGRAKLDAGDAAEAQALFESALALDDSLAVRTFLLRSWMEQGRINDALDQTDALARTNPGALDLEYLYGMAFASQAAQGADSGSSDASIGMNFEEGFGLLLQVTSKDGERYRDAFPRLARCAFESQRFEEARAAAEKSVALYPQDAACAFLLGQIAYSQYQLARAAGPELAEAHWLAARDAYTKATELYALSNKPAQGPAAARAWLRLGDVHAWKQDLERATAAYAKGIALEPAAPNYAQLWQTLGLEGFRSALEKGASAFAAASTPTDVRDATLLWWLGYARLTGGKPEDMEAAEQAFRLAVQKWPSYVNSYFYIAMARYQRQDWPGTLAALREHWSHDEVDLLAAINADSANNLAKLDYLVSRSLQVDAGVQTWKAAYQSQLDAAFLSEVQAQAQPETHRYWNNLGLFLRDAADTLTRARKTPEEAQAAALEAKALYERSYAAYAKALQLDPQNPNYMNDLAVVLHYNLERDLEMALELYQQAHARAQALIDSGSLSPDLLEVVKIALRDSGNNYKLLKAQLDKRLPKDKQSASGG